VAKVSALIIAAPTFAGPSLTPHAAEYKVKISVLGGQLNTELRATDTGYVATHVIRPTGMSRILARGTIRETSEFDAMTDGIRPRFYSSKDTISRDKADVSVRFNWETGEARGTVNGDLLNQGPDSTYTMFEVDRLRHVNVRIIGTREIDTPAGRFAAIGIQHQAEGSKRITTLWCAKELGYLPVIIEQHRNGKLRVRATLRKYSPGSN